MQQKILKSQAKQARKEHKTALRAETESQASQEGTVNIRKKTRAWSVKDLDAIVCRPPSGSASPSSHCQKHVP